VSIARDEGLVRLGIDAEKLAAAPRITQQLRMIARTIRGGRNAEPPYGPGADIDTAWAVYLDGSDDDGARFIRAIYYSIPKHMRRALPIEAFCVAAGVSPLKILEVLTATLVRLGAQASTVIAAVNHPRVVEKTVEMALTDDGVKDREMLHKHANFLPTPAGAKTSIVVTQTATAQAAAVPAPPPEQTIRRLADRFNLARTLPESASTTPMPAAPPVTDADVVEAEYTTEDDEAEESDADVRT